MEVPSLRVMGGVARGRKLKSPHGLAFRPTTGRVKEFIFSYIGESIEEAHFLDLFAGSGSLGIEALSRGAGQGIFIEMSRKNLNLLKSNIHLCGFRSRALVYHGDVFRWLKKLSGNSSKFHYIFADPPFKGMYRQDIVESVFTGHLLTEQGELILEHEKHDEDKSLFITHLIRQREFGSCKISIYKG